jgi:hypothetical protein
MGEVMTEGEWLSCEDPWRLRFGLWWNLSVRLSPRQERLLACANLRRLWTLLEDPRSRDAVVVSERFADGMARPTDLKAAYKAAGAVAGPDGEPQRLAARAAQDAAHERPGKWEMLLADMPAALANRAEEESFLREEYDLFRKAEAAGAAAREEERRAQARLIRDLCHPFRQPAKVGKGGQLLLGGNVLKLAEAAYEHRSLPSGHLDPERLGILADALEEAGVVDAATLSHLRSPGGVHVRGCFAVDAVLGRS